MTRSRGKKPELASPVRFHDLRHTAASFTLEVAGNVEAALTTVQRRLGHKNIRTTADIYGHRTKQADRNLAGGLARYREQARADSAARKTPVGKS